jgi:hypothetical protein
MTKADRFNTNSLFKAKMLGNKDVVVLSMELRLYNGNLIIAQIVIWIMQNIATLNAKSIQTYN